MHTPSIESIFVRKQEERSYPIAKHLYEMPLVGSLARAWVRATRSTEPQTLWATLPPLSA
jgi:hypothetical protein